MLNQIHKMLGREYTVHNRQFPVPTTENSVKKLRSFFGTMLRELVASKEIKQVPDEMKGYLCTQLDLSGKPVDEAHNGISKEKRQSPLGTTSRGKQLSLEHAWKLRNK